MGMCKSVSIEELKKDNPRMCLSPLRVFGKCDECPIMRRYYIDQTRKESQGVKPCESAVFSKERLSYLKEKKEISNKIKILNLELEELKGRYQ